MLSTVDAACAHQFRGLKAEDVDTLRKLDANWFPVAYDDVRIRVCVHVWWSRS